MTDPKMPIPAGVAASAGSLKLDPETAADQPPPGGGARGAKPSGAMWAGICVLLMGLTWGVFAQTLSFDFVNLDDFAYVTMNPYMTGFEKESLVWSWTNSAATGNWHPLTWMSLLLDVHFFGKSPAALHATNVVLHSANVLLLLVILYRTTGAIWPSAATAALFAIHPLHVESVAWISERKDVLSTFFGLLAILAYTRYVRRQDRLSMGGCAVCLLLSLLSKQMLVTLPAVLLLMDYWPLRRLQELPPRDRFRRLLREKTPLILLVLVFCVVAVIAQRKGSALRSLDDFSIMIRVGNALVVYVKYLFQAVVPIHLTAFYPHPGAALPIWQVAGSTVILAWTTRVAWRLRNASPWLLFGWFWYLGTLVPVIGLVQIGSQQMADRYTYVPLIGPCIALCWQIVAWCAGRPGRAVPIAVGSAAALALLTVLAHLQTSHWRSSLTLFQHAVDVGKPSAFCENSLGNALQEAGHIDLARRHFEKAVQIDPKFELALNNLGKMHLAAGEFEEARNVLERALVLDPGSSLTHGHLGDLYAKGGDVERAESHYEEAIRHEPGNLYSKERLAELYRTAGRTEEALALMRELKQIDPRSPKVYNMIGALMVDLNRPDEARNNFLLALRFDPEFVFAHNNLGILAHRNGRISEAVEHFRDACRLRPENVEFVENLSGALVGAGMEAARLNQDAEARQLLGEALELTPHSFFAIHRSALFALKQGRRQEARTLLEQALAPETDARKASAVDLATCHYDLGAVLASDGQFPIALQHFRAALKLAPGMPAAKRAIDDILSRESSNKSESAAPDE